MGLRDVPLDDLLGEMVLFAVTDPERANRAVAEIKRRPAEPWTDPVLVGKVAGGLYEVELRVCGPSTSAFGAAHFAEARRVLGEPGGQP